MLSCAAAWNLISYNPCRNVSAPKQNRANSDIKHFTLEQVNYFLQSIEEEDTQHKVIAYLAIISGMRVGELTALTWDDINYKDNTINIDKATSMVKGGQIITPPKNKTSVRVISVPTEIMSLLKQLQLEQKAKRLQLGSKWVDANFVFVQWNGEQINYYTPSHWFRKHLQRYNEALMSSDLSQAEKDKRFLPNITFHGLRHTSATLLISQHVDVRTVSNRLGHAQTSTTMNIYAHSLKQSDENAANLLGDILQVKSVE